MKIVAVCEYNYLVIDIVLGFVLISVKEVL